MQSLTLPFFIELFYLSFNTIGNLVIPSLTTATQSSTYKSFSANKTIDGKPGKLWMFDGSCSHTDERQTEAWLKIILGKVYNVKAVHFWYRNDSK